MIAFRLASDAEEFIELAKFRALRIVWARVEEACGLVPRGRSSRPRAPGG